LHAEIQFVETYLQLEKFRFKDKFAYEIKIDENVNHVLIIPKLIVQIFVENAIKHGLMHKEKDGLLTITIKRSGNNHLIIIKDNGIGRERAKQYAIHSTGKGLAIVRKLIRIFNEQNQANLSFQIIDLTNEGISSGTMIEITIPDFKRTN
jgi:sensor histidine kinase YesM